MLCLASKLKKLEFFLKEFVYPTITIPPPFVLHKDLKHSLALPPKTFLNTIANGRRLAGGFYLTPRAIANDGLLDICMISQLSLPGRLKELLRVIKQKHTEDEVVNYFSTDKIIFEFDNQVPAHLDGEMYFDSRFEVSILPRHLKTIYNPNGNHYFEIEK